MDGLTYYSLHKEMKLKIKATQFSLNTVWNIFENPNRDSVLRYWD